MNEYDAMKMGGENTRLVKAGEEVLKQKSRKLHWALGWLVLRLKRK
jgi:hypothetical protein